MKYGITLGYVSKLNSFETVKGIELIKNKIKSQLKKNFGLIEVSSAVVTDKNLWLNDDAQQTRRPIDFDISFNNSYGEVLQSNNKWRRNFLLEAEFEEKDKGIITDFFAIERDAEMTNTSSITFHELGMEILKSNYSIEEVNSCVTDIFKIINDIDNEVSEKFKKLTKKHFGNTLIFVTYKKLKELYPLLTFKERINKFGKDNGAFVLQEFVSQLFNQNNVGQFSSDVFDFSTYSKIYFYNTNCEKAVSIGYVSYSVDREKFKAQNSILKENQKTQTEYQNKLKSDLLPLTITSGIYVDRIVMAILEKQHIGEVTSSVWDQKFLNYCNTNNIKIF
ncbi:asparagine synthetase AsnA [Spiroplasma helicoides]|uniref:Asparagine synthetase AsnA n=1 Tax=Spiroplasma helicoides TaxID=216938 RepID=A0A1B3SJ63_9MOLU|nr:hypothetical protein [Spiroplasma helicoides]AOG59974.1 asparagine synthetase AsnA [Spiroplasma helicoides]